MIHVLRAAFILAVLTSVSAGAAPQAGQTAPPAPGPADQTPPATTTPPPQTPAPATQKPAPGAAAASPTAAAPAVCPAPAPPATAPARAFTAQTGLLLHPVQPTRVADFERFLLYVRDALARSTSATLLNQARGWRFFRMAEAGPNGDVIYAFLLDPAVPCVDYALGPILAEAYTDPAQLQEIWKLYTASVRSGGTIMNLAELAAAPPPPIITPPTVAPDVTKGPTVPGTTTTPGQTPAPGVPTTPAPAPPPAGPATPPTPRP